MKTLYIYTLTDPIDGLVKYVGMTNNPKRRLSEHLIEKTLTKKNNWIKSLIKKNKKPIMDVIDEITDSNIEYWEKYWIAQFKAWGFKLKNDTEGGDNPPIRYGSDNSFKIPIVAEKILEMNHARKGKTFEELYGNKRAKQLKKIIKQRTTGKNNPMYNKSQTNETKIKIGLANSGENNGNFGKALSLEHIEILRLVNTNKIVSNETKEKLRVSALSRPPVSQETKDKIKVATSKEKNGNFKGVVYQYTKNHELVKTWLALYEIKEVYGNKFCNISSCITGKLKTAYGYVWSRERLELR